MNEPGAARKSSSCESDAIDASNQTWSRHIVFRWLQRGYCNADATVQESPIKRSLEFPGQAPCSGWATCPFALVDEASAVFHTQRSCLLVRRPRNALKARRLMRSTSSVRWSSLCVDSLQTV